MTINEMRQWALVGMLGFVIGSFAVFFTDFDAAPLALGSLFLMVWFGLRIRKLTRSNRVAGVPPSNDAGTENCPTPEHGTVSQGQHAETEG